MMRRLLPVLALVALMVAVFTAPASTAPLPGSKKLISASIAGAIMTMDSAEPEMRPRHTSGQVKFPNVNTR